MKFHNVFRLIAEDDAGVFFLFKGIFMVYLFS